MTNSLAATRQRLTEISSQLLTANHSFPTVDSEDNANMTTEQRTAMRVALAEAETLIDSVRKQLFAAQI